jgi:uncharacterized protein (TIGR04255 family)
MTGDLWGAQRSMQMVPELHFDNPPLREVKLSLFFDAIRSLRTLHLGPLRAEWHDEYPKLSESAPLAPWQRPDPPSVVEFIGTGSNWPVPFCWFTNLRGDRALQLQSDRFIVSWRFDPDSGRYPGFVELRRELAERFDRFSKVVEAAVGQQPDVRQVEVEYSNLIAGIRPEELALGVLTEWQTRDLGIGRSINYLGLRVRYYESADSPGVGVLVGVDPAEGLDRPDETAESASTLTLNADCQVAETDEYLAQISRCHDVIIMLFLRLTTSEMHEKWGARE